MKSFRRSSQRGVEPKTTIRSLGPWAVAAFAMLVIFFVPTVFDPTRIASGPLRAFYAPKFEALMWFSAALLVAVLGAVLLNRRHPEVPVLLPALAFLNISALSALFSPDVENSFVGDRYGGLLSLDAGVLLFYATARFLDSWARVRAFLTAGVAAAVIVSTYGVLQGFGLG